MDRRHRLGEPDFRLAGLAIWISGYQYRDANDYWDGNWLRAVARVDTLDAWVEASGSFLRVDEFAVFCRELEALEKSLSGNAELPTMEPDLALRITGRSLGHFEMRVEITPDHISQRHEFRFDIDQTYLKPAIAQCRQLLERFPLRGSPPA